MTEDKTERADEGRVPPGHRLLECLDCGLFQTIPPMVEGEAAHCERCSAVLRREVTSTPTLPLACASSALLLFALALSEPFMRLSAVGRISSATLYTGPSALTERGLWPVAVVVFVTLLVMPALKLGVLVTVLLGLRARHQARWLPWLFGCFEKLSPWAMIEVFLLGVFVGYTRLRDMASVQIGPALFMIGGVMLATVAAEATLDTEGVWEALDTGREARSRRPWAAGEVLIGCHTCRLVDRAHDGERCARCGHRVHARKRNSIVRAWSLVAGAAALYVPANVLPVMSVTRLGRGGPSTIINGVRELIEARLWPLAVVVFVASIVVPVFKLVALAFMLISTQRGSTARLVGRTRVFRLISVIGRWSMIDIFTLTTLVALVRMGFLADVWPGDGAEAFCAVVILTMFAAESFDPRLMWDVPAPEPGAASGPYRARAT